MEEKQLNMPDEHPVPKKKEKERPDAFLLAYSYPCRRRQPLATISTNAASQPKN